MRTYFIYKLLSGTVSMAIANILVQESIHDTSTSPSSLCSFFRLYPLDEFFFIRAFLSIQKYPLRLLLFSYKLLLFPTFSYYFISEPPTFVLLFHQGRVESLYYYQTLKISIFCSYFLHLFTRRLCSVRRPSVPAVLSVLLFVRLKPERYDIFVLK